MHLKDHYEILEVEPSATIQEIKTSFRKLAKQFHPDKHQNDPYASAQFTEIKEAYEVLTNHTKKNLYLQQRWYNQHISNRQKNQPVTPINILKQSLKLEKHVHTLDPIRMDKQGLEQYLLSLLSNQTIDLLIQFKEPDIISSIIAINLKTINSLPPKHATAALIQLKKLAEGLDSEKQKIDEFATRTNEKYRRKKLSIGIVFVITLILCFLIFLAGG